MNHSTRRAKIVSAILFARHSFVIGDQTAAFHSPRDGYRWCSARRCDGIVPVHRRALNSQHVPAPLNLHWTKRFHALFALVACTVLSSCDGGFSTWKQVAS